MQHSLWLEATREACFMAPPIKGFAFQITSIGCSSQIDAFLQISSAGPNKTPRALVKVVGETARYYGTRHTNREATARTGMLSCEQRESSGAAGAGHLKLSSGKLHSKITNKY